MLGALYSFNNKLTKKKKSGISYPLECLCPLGKEIGFRQAGVDEKYSRGMEVFFFFCLMILEGDEAQEAFRLSPTSVAAQQSKKKKIGAQV